MGFTRDFLPKTSAVIPDLGGGGIRDSLQDLVGNASLAGMMGLGDVGGALKSAGQDYARDYQWSPLLYDDYGLDSSYYRYSDGYQGTGYEGVGYEGSGYTGDGYTGSGPAEDGYTGDGYTGDGYSGAGYEGDGYFGGSGTVKPGPAERGGALRPEDLYNELDFDPNGYSQETTAAMNPIDALRAYAASEEAFAATDQAFGKDGGHNDSKDAFRHAYWNYIMAQRIGGSEAKKFGDSHERYSKNKAGETMMDLYNNNMGRILAQDPKNKDRDPAEVILEAIANGQLRTSEFEVAP